MPYDYDDFNSQSNRQRDLVLSVNEFCFLQSKTNGTIKTYTGPTTMTISGQENLVIFDYKTKRFVETQDFEKAKQLFVSAPEGWYIVLKNPAVDGSHPEAGKAANSAELEIGHKVNISGPVSFSLFPGQMAKVVRGHRLRSNQYLLARVYDADAASAGSADGTVIDADGNTVETKQQKYFVGQLLVIKGTEVSFYIPPTGIEVIPVDEYRNAYVREAVTLERLEYAVLKDEDGEKRYVHGPAVVFPKPTESFVTDSDGPVFKAIELSPISGIYVKVIAAYDENDLHHPIGEELFITGNDQMIYYPRPEHAIIQYENKFMHHAIAIPKGEGRYILNRLTGTITTIKGPTMYLPDPRKEVVVKRILSDKECELMYPGNMEVLSYNTGLQDTEVSASTLDGLKAMATSYSTGPNSKFSRGNTYSKPRTITLDNKYDGVVTIDVWTGYAVNVVSKSGKREVVLGPTTRLLDYDETIEAMELSTGKPKNTDRLLRTGYLRIENNKIADIVSAQTSDFVNVDIKLSYCVNFLEEYKDKWFNVENYVKYLCDHMRSLIKKEVKKYTIQDFYNNSIEIIRNLVLNIGNEKGETGRLFTENGMFVYDVDILKVSMDGIFERIFDDCQEDIVRKTIELSSAQSQYEITQQLEEYKRQEAKARTETDLLVSSLKYQKAEDASEKKAALQALVDEAEAAKKQAELDLQEMKDQIAKHEADRQREAHAVELERKSKAAEIEQQKQAAYAEAVKSVIESIGPELVAALTSKANADMLSEVSKNMSPYAIANGDSVADTVNTLMRGTCLDQAVQGISELVAKN